MGDTTDTVEIMFNAGYGGFGLSEDAQRLYKERGGVWQQDLWKIPRDDALMVSIVKELKEAASGFCNCVRITTIPARFREHFRISEYDGLESVVIKYNSYRAATAKRFLKDESLPLAERVERATAALEEKFADENNNNGDDVVVDDD